MIENKRALSKARTVFFGTRDYGPWVAARNASVCAGKPGSSSSRTMQEQSTADVDNFVGNPAAHAAKPREITHPARLLKL
jgi:hypothetical protein